MTRSARRSLGPVLVAACVAAAAFALGLTAARGHVRDLTAVDATGPADAAPPAAEGSAEPRTRASSADPAPAPPAPPTGLDPGLVRALDAATRAAAGDGHTIVVNSGFRTADEQAELLAEAVLEHGSLDAAMHWVFPPERSMHVQGLAVDIGDESAAAWLDRNGAAFGLCRTLDWEWWHFEWRASWEAAGTCPAPVDDPADAPPADA